MNKIHSGQDYPSLRSLINRYIDGETHRSLDEIEDMVYEAYTAGDITPTEYDKLNAYLE